MRLSDQDSAKGASQGLTEVASKVGVAEGSSKDSAKDVLIDSAIGRKARSTITKARKGHFKNFFMC
jgi:hypothetical protein